MHPLSEYAERRPQRTEGQRSDIAERMSYHLPRPEKAVHWSDEDVDAMKAAFIKRFDEDLPRTETLFAVAMIGYRIALRDLAATKEERL